MTLDDGVELKRRTPNMQSSCVTLDTALWDESSHHHHNHNNENCNENCNENYNENENELAGPEPGVTFCHQDGLPRLPIPNLQETLNQLLQFLEALQTKEQKLQAQQAVLEFINGDGPKLQELLIQYDTQGIEKAELGSYIEEFWNESYLVPDQSVVLNLNPFFVLEDGPDPKTAKDPIRRAASLCFAAIKLASMVREETLLPDTFKDNPLCMDQFKAVFGAARVPHLEGDDIDVYPFSSHVVVMCRNQLFYFQALWPDGIVAVDEEDICEILIAIDKNARQVPDVGASAPSCPGVLTSLGRREWAKIRQELSRISNNEQYLTIVDSGLFVLVLDNVNPNSVDEAAANMLHGTFQVDVEKHALEDPSSPYPPGVQLGSCCNRWYDKMQIIVCANGTAGINFEHSAIDGHTALRIVSDIYAETVVNFAQSITKTVPAHGKIPHVIDAPVDRAGTQSDDTIRSPSASRPALDVLPKKITLEIPERLKRKIFHAEAHLGDEIVASETHVLEFKDYGKKLITANNMSPDAFVQMSMMLAYYKVYGKLVCAYEPVLTKSFFHGRTEAMRSATVPAKELCETFMDPLASAPRKVAALRRAITVHTQCVKECSRGKGVDRHLFALKCIAERHDFPVPALFKSEAWRLLNHTVLSTSNCGNPSLRLFGFGPAVADGYGIGYIIKDNSIHYSVSSKRRQTERYVRALNGVLKDMAKLLKRKGVTHHRKAFRTAVRSFPKQSLYGDMWGQTAQPRRNSNSPSMRGKKVGDRWVQQGSDHTPGITNNGSNLALPPRDAAASRPASRDSHSAPAAVAEGHTDVLPQKPQRRGSRFSRMTERETLSFATLSQSGESLDFDLADEADTMCGSHF